MNKNFILSTGSYLPKKTLSNDDIALIVDTSDEWIKQRTGISQRHIADEEELTSDLAINAAKNAIEKAKISANEIDLIIVATTTADKTFPSCATIAQNKLECKNAFAFDVQAACSGFIYAVTVADSLMKSNGQIKHALVIGAETMSRIVDWKDRSTCILFGDGAGAVVIKSGADNNRPLAESVYDEKFLGESQMSTAEYSNVFEERNQVSTTKLPSETELCKRPNGIISANLYSDGNTDILCTSGGISSTLDAGKICMNGREVFKHAVDKLVNLVENVLKDNNLEIAKIDWLIPHQANVRIIETVTKKLGLPMEKVINTVDKHANTSAASIPLALDYALQESKIKPGDLVLLISIGAGLTWGAVLLHY